MISVLPALDVDADFLARLHAVEEHRRRQHAGIGILRLMRGEVGEDARIEQMRDHPIVDRSADLAFPVRARAAAKSAGGRLAPGRPHRLAAAQDALLQLLREAARRFAEPALEELHHRFGKRQFARAVEHFRRRQVVADHEQGHVADHLGGRRHLDDVAEQAVDLGVHPADFGPALVQPERLRPAGTGSCTGRPASRCDRRPPSARAGRSRRQRTACAPPPSSRRLRCSASNVEAGVARLEAQRLDQGVQARLAGHAGERRHGASTIDTPSSAASSSEAIWPPAQSCVWKWIGMPISCCSACTSFCAAYGLHSPAMSLMASRLAPSFSSCLARST